MSKRLTRSTSNAPKFLVEMGAPERPHLLTSVFVSILTFKNSVLGRALRYQITVPRIE